MESGCQQPDRTLADGHPQAAYHSLSFGDDAATKVTLDNPTAGRLGCSDRLQSHHTETRAARPQDWTATSITYVDTASISARCATRNSTSAHHLIQSTQADKLIWDSWGT